MSAPSHIDLFDFIQRVGARVGEQPRKRYRRTPHRVDGALTIGARTVAFEILKKGEIVLSLECDDDDRSARGRTTELVDAVEVASVWLQGALVSAVRELADFVDRPLRILEAIEARARDTVSAELKYRYEHVRDQHELWLERADRAVVVSELRPAVAREIVHRPHPTIEARFMWRGELVFALAEAEERVLRVVDRWLCDESPPTALSTEFTWLDLDEQAYWHEQGDLVEQEFEHSWSAAHQYFAPRAKDLPGLTEFIDDLRARGFSTRLRVGHEMNTFVASRARHHVLTDEHSWVKFNVFPGEFHVRYELDAESGAQDFPSVEVSTRVLELLELLATQPIS